MRIAIDLRTLSGGGKISGVENYLLNILNGTSFDPHIFVGVVNSFSKISNPSSGRIPAIVRRIPNKILNATLTALNLPLFEKLYGNFDVLWLPDIRPFALAKEAKLAVTVHDLSTIMHPQFYSFKRRLWHRVSNYKKALHRADIIFAVSEYTKSDIVNLFNIDAGKIKVIYPGIDHSRFNTNLDQRLIHKTKQKYGLPNKYILSISTVEPRKNIEGIISAFEHIKDPGVHLVIAGRLGWLYDDVLLKVRNSAKKDKIKLLGYIEEREKPHLIAGAEMVCYPSFYEGFGFVPIEAMACGVPVITSARTSMPEVCANAALLVEPYQAADLISAMEILLNDRLFRDNLIAKGLQRAKLYNWNSSAVSIKESLLSL